MAKLIIDNWLGGISSSDRLGTEGSYFLGNAVNPTHELGYLKPGGNPINLQISTSASDVLSAEINAMVVDSENNNLYSIEKASENPTSLLRTAIGNFITTTVTEITATPINIGGNDVTIYPVGETNYCFYSYTNITRGDVGRGSLTGSFAADDDFMSQEPAGAANLTKGIQLKMLSWGENGYLYISNGRYLASFDGQTGANGTLDTAALTLPVGWTITSLFDAGEYIGITANYSIKLQKSGIFFWDGTSDTWNKTVTVPDKSIEAAITIDGEFYTIGTTISRDGIIRKWDGTKFKLVQIIDDNVLDVQQVLKGHGSVDEYQGMLIFTTNYGKIMLYGSPSSGLPPALYHITTCEGEDKTNTQGYAIKSYANSAFFASSDDTQNAVRYLTRFTMNLPQNTDFLWKSLYYEFNQKVRLNYIKLYHKTASSKDDDITIEIDHGKSTHLVGTVTTGNSTKLSCKLIPLCNSFRVIIDADTTAGVVYAKLEIDYDLVDDNGNTT